MSRLKARRTSRRVAQMTRTRASNEPLRDPERNDRHQGRLVTPAHAGVQSRDKALSLSRLLPWTPAFAGMTPLYLIGSGASFTIAQFLSARLMFSLSFLRHSVV